VNGRAPDDWLPLDPDEHERQIEAVLALLAPAPQRVLDLGAGDGRVAGHLRDAGHDVVCIDSDPDAVEACAAQGLSVRVGDMLDPDLDLTVEDAPPHAALLLGHTFLLLDDTVDALSLLRRLAGALVPGGVVALDDFCEPLWREVHEGAWREGVSDDGAMQMVWAPGEPVFTLRHGDAVDPDDWTIHPGERRMRLYSLGELRLLASAAGLAGPENDAGGALLLFRTPGAG